MVRNVPDGAGPLILHAAEPQYSRHVLLVTSSWGEATACARGTFTDVCFGLVMRSMISIVWRYHEGIDSGGQTGQASSFQA